tara:strand:- start:1711 stop:2178 length:468 start_codon:yes stop_codon:yes gene_type:complete
MGAGGEAPPVKGEDVMILLGASIILLMLILQTWVVPTNIEEGAEEEFIVKYDLSEGNIFSIEVNEGVVRPHVYTPSGEWEVFDDNDESWEYVAEESGVHSFKILGIEDSEIEYSLSRGIIFDYGLYVVGALILGFGILKKMAAEEDEPIEAVLED